MSDTIFVVNAGSSSIKFQLFSVHGDGQCDRLMKGQFDGIGARPHLYASSGEKPLIDETWRADEIADVPGALDEVVKFVRAYSRGSLPIAVGHRVVHGGPAYRAPTIVNEAVMRKLEALVPLAPLHQPNNLAPIRILLERQPHLPQVACFDTAFHRGHAEVADRYAIPADLYDEGIRRYGFHGLSYEYIAQSLGSHAPELVGKKIIAAHLGSGASMCAIVNGRSVESTMGFTALDGLPMGTRPGQLDAGVVLYLVDQKHLGSRELNDLLYKQCGLKGLSGISNDVRELLASTDPRAKMALEYFTYRIALFAGQLTAAMRGLDGFIFTAGIGEHAPSIREAVLRQLDWLGVKLDPVANVESAPRISARGSKIACYVIPTDEELMIARHTWQTLSRPSRKPSQEMRA